MRQPDASFLREIQKAKKALVEARLRSKQGKNSAARMRYRYAIDTWKSVVIHHSIFQRDLENAIHEYESLNRADKQWHRCVAKIQRVLADGQSILRTEIYRLCPDYTKGQINKTLFHLERDETIVCTRQERDVSVRLARKSATGHGR